MRRRNLMVVAIDEETLRERGGMRAIRPILTDAGTDRRRTTEDRGDDVILSDKGDTPADARLEAALRSTRTWCFPATWWRAVGGSTAALCRRSRRARPREPGSGSPDGVSRDRRSLEATAGGQRR
jgi:hypothetical protein